MADAVRAGNRRGSSPLAVLVVVSFGVFIAADDLTVVSTMLRQIIGDLAIPLPDGFDKVAWIVNSYLVAYVAVMPFVGRLSDLVGRRRVFIGALVIFLIGSIWVALSYSFAWFMAGRVLTAIGGGAMVPVALAVIGDVYEEAKRPRAFGVLGAVDTIGWVWGPLFGALLVRFLDWRWQFYLNIPLALAGIAVAWFVLRGLDAPEAEGHIDWAGATTLAVGLVALNIALLNTTDVSTVSSLDELTGRETIPTMPLFAVAAVAFGLFVWVQRRSADPLIDPGLFRWRNVTPAVLVNFLIGAAIVIAMVDVPLFVNLVVETDLERAAVASGWVLSALTLLMAITSYAGGVATERTWYRPVTVAGLALASVGFLLMGYVWNETTSLWTMAWQLAVLGAGFGLVIAPTSSAVVDAAPADRRGTAAGVVIVFRLLGLSVGLSGLTAWALYRFQELRQSLELPPIDDPGYADALEAARARLTAQSLTETFLFSAAVVAAALVAALFLRRPVPVETIDVAGGGGEDEERERGVTR